MKIYFKEFTYPSDLISHRGGAYSPATQLGGYIEPVGSFSVRSAQSHEASFVFPKKGES